jgi:DNA (cytosine-5)-methyltransferase 1
VRYATICSGINAPAVAWNSLGWDQVFSSEIEPFPCAVLNHHAPEVPNYGNLLSYATWPIHRNLDIACGGTPCQGFSIAGLCGGLDDPRSQLSITYIEFIARNRPRWFIWENVPNVLSVHGGRDFATILGGFTGRRIHVPDGGWQNSGIASSANGGYGVAWRVLDAQFVRVDSHPGAVPQRRQRVFVVGHSGGQWQRAAAVLFERESLRGDSAPRREAGKGTAHGVAPSLTSSGRGVERCGESRGQDPVIAVSGTAPCLRSSNHHDNSDPGIHAQMLVAHSLRAEGFDASEDGTGQGTPIVPAVAWALQERDSKGEDSSTKEGHLLPVAFDTTQVTSAANRSNPKPGDPCHPLAAGAHEPCIAFPERMSGTQCASSENVSPVIQSENPTAVMTLAIRGRGDSHDLEYRQDGTSNAVLTPNGGRGGIGVGAISHGMAVRRLTPRECERLQGFPDDYTAIPFRGKPAADGPRYKALGNSMACNVMRWIGQRIEMVDKI